MSPFTQKFIIGLLTQCLFFGALLFLPAGTLNWWREWVFLGIVLALTVMTFLVVFREREDLLNERYKSPIQKGQPLSDKILLMSFIVCYLALMVFVPLDVFHWHLLSTPPMWISSFGLLAFIAGWMLIHYAFNANAFAAPVIKHQAERQQHVVNTGIYRWVRHPMYSGALLLMIGMPLWLESYAAAIFSIIPTLLLALRILLEENFLKQNLPGYSDYVQKTRFRLIPYVW